MLKKVLKVIGIVLAVAVISFFSVVVYRVIYRSPTQEESQKQEKIIKEYDFSHMKEFRGKKFTLHYPTGYDEEADYLIQQINKIIPFVEAYGGLEFHNINITIVKSREEIHGAYGEAIPAEEKFFIVADYYDAPVVYHESCHLVEAPFYYPSWFAEGRVFGDCQPKLEEFLGLTDFVDDHKKNRLEDGAKLVYIKVDLPQWTTPYTYPQKLAKTTGISEEDIMRKLQLDGMDLIGELSEVVSFTEFFKKIRKDFYGYNSPLPSDAVICELNKVATKNVIPIFKKYGFKIETCGVEAY